MTEYINRETVELKLHGKCEFCKKRDTCCRRFGSHYYCWEFDDVLFPVADVQEVKHGKWQITEYDYYDCSVCGNSYYNGCESGAEARQRLDERPYDVYKYCPNCGAKMDGEMNG